MINRIVTTLKATTTLVLLATLLLTIVIQNQAASYDPIAAMRQLKTQHRRDEALELARFYRECQPDSSDFAKLETELDYSLTEKLKASLWHGAIKGEVFDTPSGLGAMAADLTLLGDIRDLSIQGFRLITGSQDVEKATAILSGLGVAFTVTPFLDGCYVMVKNTGKYLNRFPAIAEKGLLKQLTSKSLSIDEYKQVWTLLKKTICRTTISRCSLVSGDFLSAFSEYPRSFRIISSTFFESASPCRLR